MHYPFTLGKVANCGGAAALPLRSLAKGTYSFNYVVEKVSLLTSVLGAVTGCSKNTVTPTHDQLGTLTKNNVKVTDNAVYSGSIVVAVNPPAGGIGIQLPSQSISVEGRPAPHLGQPARRAPSASRTRFPASRPTCPTGLPGGGGGGGTGGGGKAPRPGRRRQLHPAGGDRAPGGHAARGRLGRLGPVQRAGQPPAAHRRRPHRRAGAERDRDRSYAGRPVQRRQRRSGKKPVDLRDSSGGLFGKQLPVVLAIARHPGAVAGDRRVRPDGPAAPQVPTDRALQRPTPFWESAAASRVT